MKRIKFMPKLWRISGRWFGYLCVGFWSDDHRQDGKREGSVDYIQIVGPIFTVLAFECCHTTGAPISPVDPDSIQLIG